MMSNFDSAKHGTKVYIGNGWKIIIKSVLIEHVTPKNIYFTNAANVDRMFQGVDVGNLRCYTLEQVRNAEDSARHLTAYDKVRI